MPLNFLQDTNYDNYLNILLSEAFTEKKSLQNKKSSIGKSAISSEIPKNIDSIKSVDDFCNIFKTNDSFARKVRNILVRTRRSSIHSLERNQYEIIKNSFFCKAKKSLKDMLIINIVNSIVYFSSTPEKLKQTIVKNLRLITEKLIIDIAPKILCVILLGMITGILPLPMMSFIAIYFLFNVLIAPSIYLVTDHIANLISEDRAKTILCNFLESLIYNYTFITGNPQIAPSRNLEIQETIDSHLRNLRNIMLIQEIQQNKEKTLLEATSEVQKKTGHITSKEFFLYKQYSLFISTLHKLRWQCSNSDIAFSSGKLLKKFDLEQSTRCLLVVLSHCIVYQELQDIGQVVKEKRFSQIPLGKTIRSVKSPEEYKKILHNMLSDRIKEIDILSKEITEFTKSEELSNNTSPQILYLIEKLYLENQKMRELFQEEGVFLLFENKQCKQYYETLIECFGQLALVSSDLKEYDVEIKWSVYNPRKKCNTLISCTEILSALRCKVSSIFEDSKKTENTLDHHVLSKYLTEYIKQNNSQSSMDDHNLNCDENKSQQQQVSDVCYRIESSNNVPEEGIAAPLVSIHS